VNRVAPLVGQNVKCSLSSFEGIVEEAAALPSSRKRPSLFREPKRAVLLSLAAHLPLDEDASLPEYAGIAAPIHKDEPGCGSPRFDFAGHSPDEACPWSAYLFMSPPAQQAEIETPGSILGFGEIGNHYPM